MITKESEFIDLEKSISEKLITDISDYISSIYDDRKIYNSLNVITPQHISMDIFLDLNNQEFRFSTDLIEDESIKLDFFIKIRLNIKVTKNLEMNSARIKEAIKDYNDHYTSNVMKNNIYGIIYRDLSDEAKSKFLTPIIEKL